MNSFSVRTKIMEGGGLETLAPKLHKVFIVTDGFMASSGKVSYITEKLDRAGAEYRVFDQVKADPDIGTVTKGVDMIQEFHPDAVIAFGGGSPIDAAKAIVFFAAKTCDMRECMFIAVPTTSGTGSEVSKFAVITDPEKEVKYPLVEDSLLPDVAILDAQAPDDRLPPARGYGRPPGHAQCLLSGRRGLLQFRIGPQPRHGPRAGRAFPHPPRQSQRDPAALCNEFQRRLFGEPDACGQAERPGDMWSSSTFPPASRRLEWTRPSSRPRRRLWRRPPWRTAARPQIPGSVAKRRSFRSSTRPILEGFPDAGCGG